MSIAFVQSTGSIKNNTDVVILHPSITKGNMIVAIISHYVTLGGTNFITDVFGTKYDLILIDSQNFIEIWAGIASGSGETNIIAEFSSSLDHGFIMNEYSGVQRIGASSSTHGAGSLASLSLSTTQNSWLVGGITQGLGSILNTINGTRRFIVSGSVTGGAKISLASYDTPGNNISANLGNFQIWWEAVAELIPIIPLGPTQLPSAIFPNIVRPPFRMNDNIYPYPSIQVIPTTLSPIPLVCRRCGTANTAVIYRDVREYAVAMGIPSVNRGGIKKGERFDFVQCGACLTWYRKNDYKIVSNVNIIDKIPSPLNDISGNTTTAFTDGQYIGANISDDSIRIASNAKKFGFNDDFEPTGFEVIAIPTGSLDHLG